MTTITRHELRIMCKRRGFRLRALHGVDKKCSCWEVSNVATPGRIYGHVCRKADGTLLSW